MKDLGLIFDCDGVLLDSIDAWMAAEDAVAEVGGLEFSQEDRNYLGTLTMEEAGEYFHTHFGVGASTKEVVHIIDDCMMDYYTNKARACAGVHELLEEAAKSDRKSVVVSSSPMRYLKAGLDSTGLSMYFEELFSANDLNLVKREPEIFNRAQQIIEVDPCRIWGFDDTSYALDTMVNAGYRAVGIHSSDLCSTHKMLEQAATQGIVYDGFDNIELDKILEWNARINEN